ncbi:MAG: hypothetical protein HY821_02220 [Acidobacteria bacterium]|nr:hypothetical protein [Acidobacteriota bacterium]
MLKPWVVEALGWGYRGGLLLMMVGVVWLWWEKRRKGRTWRRCWAAMAAMAAGWGSVVAAARGLEYEPPNLFIAAICAVTFGYLWRVNPQRRIHWLRLVPLVAGVLVSGWVLDLGSDAAMWRLLPEFENRLGRGLVCRAYPVPEDSLSHPRLMLIKESDGWRDEVLDELEGNLAARFPSCESLPGGEVRLYIRDVDGRESVEKRAAARK